MKAPDKIYVEQKAIMYDLVNTEPCKLDDLEYIRKDALLEWADNWKKLGVSEDFLYAIDILVQHLNSM